MRVLALGLLLWCGCPKHEEPPEFDPNDRLLQKMKAEQERLAKAPPRTPEPDPLAEIAARPGKPETLGIPAGVAADLGPVSLTLLEVQQSQTVSGGKVSLATTERFLKVTLEASTKKDVDLNLSGATLALDDTTVPIARDAQRAGQGSSLVTSLGAGRTEKLVLFFEVPDGMIRKGLKIILTTPESRVELALQ